MLLVALFLSVPSPQIDGADYELTPGASFAWEQQLDLGAPLAEDARFLVAGGATWLELVQVYDLAGERVAARAFDRATGVLAWSSDGVFGGGGAGEEQLVGVDAIADGASAFPWGVRDGVWHVAKLDVATGAVAWDVAEGGASLGTLDHVGAVAASPDGSWVAVAGASAISPYDATVVVLDGATGAPLWSLHGGAFGDPQGYFDRAEATSSALFVSAFDAGPAQRRLFALDAATGAELWQAPVGDEDFGFLTANPSGTRVAAVRFAVVQVDPFTFFVDWSQVWNWDVATGAGVLVSAHDDTAVLGLAFDGDDRLVAASVPSDPWGAACAQVTVRSHALALGASWTAALAPAFGPCETDAARLLVTPDAALVAVQSATPESAGRVEVHALALADGGLSWSTSIGPDPQEGQQPLAQLAGDGTSIGVTTRVHLVPSDLRSTRLSTLAPDDGAVAWTRTDTESGPASDLTLDVALAPDGATLFALESVNSYGLELRAVATATGATAWQKTLDVESITWLWGAFRGDVVVAPAGDAVYAHVRGLQGTAGVTRLIAFDAQTGAELWSADVADIDTSGLLRRSLATDASGETLFTAAGKFALRVQASSASDGSLLWDAPVPFPSGGGSPFEGVRDLEASEATGLVYALASFYQNGSATDPDVFVAALDAATGAVVWTRHLDPATEFSFSEGASLSVDPTGDRVVVAFEDDQFTHVLPDASRVVALDALTGAVRWSHALPGAGELEHARVVAHALGGARAVVAGAKAIDDPEFRVVAAAFDAAGAKVWETAVPTAFPVEVTSVLANADGTAVAVVASQPVSSWGLPPFKDQGYVVLWLDAVDGSVLWSATATTPADGTLVRTQLLDAALDDAGLYVGGLHFDYPAGGTMDRYVARFLLPTLTTPATELSVTQGGAVAMALRPGADRAGHLYLVLGSITGTQPGIPIAPGVVLPLVFDPWTNLTLQHAGNPAILPGTIGVLDAYGRAAAAYLGQGSGATALVGLELFHAYGTMDPATGVIGPASNPVATEFVD